MSRQTSKDVQIEVFNKGICTYKQIADTINDKAKNVEIDNLKRGILKLKKELNLKQKELDKMTEKNVLIRNLLKANMDLKSLFNEIKQSHIEDLKNEWNAKVEF